MHYVCLLIRCYCFLFVCLFVYLFICLLQAHLKIDWKLQKSELPANRSLFVYEHYLVLSAWCTGLFQYGGITSRNQQCLFTSALSRCWLWMQATDIDNDPLSSSLYMSYICHSCFPLGSLLSRLSHLTMLWKHYIVLIVQVYKSVLLYVLLDISLFDCFGHM